MTIEYTVGCCSCGVKPCLGNLCPNLQPYEQIVCDICSEETKVYEFDDAELCIDCILKQLPVSDAICCEHCGDAETVLCFRGEQLCAACIEEKLQEDGCYVDI